MNFIVNTFLLDAIMQFVASPYWDALTDRFERGSSQIAKTCLFLAKISKKRRSFLERPFYKINF